MRKVLLALFGVIVVAMAFSEGRTETKRLVVFTNSDPEELKRIIREICVNDRYPFERYINLTHKDIGEFNPKELDEKDFYPAFFIDRSKGEVPDTYKQAFPSFDPTPRAENEVVVGAFWVKWPPKSKKGFNRFVFLVSSPSEDSLHKWTHWLFWKAYKCGIWWRPEEKDKDQREVERETSNEPLVGLVNNRVTVKFITFISSSGDWQKVLEMRQKSRELQEKELKEMAQKEGREHLAAFLLEQRRAQMEALKYDFKVFLLEELTRPETIQRLDRSAEVYILTLPSIHSASKPVQEVLVKRLAGTPKRITELEHNETMIGSFPKPDGNKTVILCAPRPSNWKLDWRKPLFQSIEEVPEGLKVEKLVCFCEEHLKVRSVAFLGFVSTGGLPNSLVEGFRFRLGETIGQQLPNFQDRIDYLKLREEDRRLIEQGRIPPELKLDEDAALIATIIYSPSHTRRAAKPKLLNPPRLFTAVFSWEGGDFFSRLIESIIENMIEREGSAELAPNQNVAPEAPPLPGQSKGLFSGRMKEEEYHGKYLPRFQKAWEKFTTEFSNWKEEVGAQNYIWKREVFDEYEVNVTIHFKLLDLRTDNRGKQLCTWSVEVSDKASELNPSLTQESMGRAIVLPMEIPRYKETACPEGYGAHIAYVPEVKPRVVFRIPSFPNIPRPDPREVPDAFVQQVLDKLAQKSAEKLYEIAIVEPPLPPTFEPLEGQIGRIAEVDADKVIVELEGEVKSGQVLQVVVKRGNRVGVIADLTVDELKGNKAVCGIKSGSPSLLKPGMSIIPKPKPPAPPRVGFILAVSEDIAFVTLDGNQAKDAVPGKVLLVFSEDEKSAQTVAYLQVIQRQEEQNRLRCRIIYKLGEIKQGMVAQLSDIVPNRVGEVTMVNPQENSVTIKLQSVLIPPMSVEKGTILQLTAQDKEIARLLVTRIFKDLGEAECLLLTPQSIGQIEKGQFVFALPPLERKHPEQIGEVVAIFRDRLWIRLVSEAEVKEGTRLVVMEDEVEIGEIEIVHPNKHFAECKADTDILANIKLGQILLTPPPPWAVGRILRIEQGAVILKLRPKIAVHTGAVLRVLGTEEKELARLCVTNVDAERREVKAIVSPDNVILQSGQFAFRLPPFVPEHKDEVGKVAFIGQGGKLWILTSASNRVQIGTRWYVFIKEGKAIEIEIVSVEETTVQAKLIETNQISLLKLDQLVIKPTKVQMEEEIVGATPCKTKPNPKEVQNLLTAAKRDAVQKAIQHIYDNHGVKVSSEALDKIAKVISHNFDPQTKTYKAKVLFKGVIEGPKVKRKEKGKEG